MILTHCLSRRRDASGETHIVRAIPRLTFFVTFVIFVTFAPSREPVSVKPQLMPRRVAAAYQSE